MNLPVFSDSPICRSRIHCVDCRSKTSAGVMFRANLSKRFSGIGEEDECPFGVPWNTGKQEVPSPVEIEVVQSIPRDQWPLAVRVVARMSKTGEAGVGDTLKRLIAGIGGEQYKRLMKRIGVDCGCDARRRMLNAKYPYSGE